MRGNHSPVGEEMKPQRRPPLLALSALLLCTLTQVAGSHHSSSSSSSSSSSDRNNVGMNKNLLRHINTSSSHESRPSLELSSNSSSTSPTGSDRVWGPETGVSPVCAYRVIEGGIGGQLCFRHTVFGFRCHMRDCRTVVSSGNLVANILTNGSVLLQWSPPGPEPNSTTQEEPRAAGQRHRRRGFELSCWWNGSYTQFECAGVHLGSGCRDFLLVELHQNFPYRFCLRSLDRRTEQRDCVHFTLPPSGMQDIVIAMTTVGGAICVMLVIICLLVAYITENIMSPATQHTHTHTHSYRTHSRH